MIRPTLFCALFALAAAPAFADVSLNAQTAPKGTYKVEPNHTSVMFCIRHMEISNFCGRFNKIQGKISFNGAQAEKSTASIEIDTSSIDTPSDTLDDKLRKEFFETEKFPTANFTTTSIKITGKNQGDITGNLTLHGVTKPVTLKASFNGGQVHPFANAYVVAFSATATIKIADFSFPDVAWKIFITDEVSLHIESEFIAEK